nr:reverse transcriptase domain-containing protein [Tanacetum cinerariifolium]
LAQIDTFYNGLNDDDQDSLNAATGGNLLTVGESCVTCGGPHAHYNCDATNRNQPSFCVAMGTYNKVAPQNRASNYMAPPGFASAQKNRQNSFANTLLLMPKFAFIIKSLLTNKDKLFELGKVPLNENCTAMLLKKLPENLGDLGKFLIPCDFPRIDAEETKAKSSIEEPHKLELKELPSHLEYAFLEDTDKLPGIDLRFCTHKILMEEDYKPAVQSQRRVNPKIHDVIKKEVIKLLDARMIYPISDSPWVSPIHCVHKKGGMTVVANENNELIPTRLVTGWRVCIDYMKLNDATRKDHFSLPFMDQMLERLAGNEFYCFLDGFLGYFQIPIDPQDQEKTTFTCPYATFAYRRMPFGLCNALGTFQRCMMAIFHDMIEKTMEVFMDDFSVFGDNFSSCLSKKCHFMCKEGIVLGHKISKYGTEVDRAKVDVIAKLPHPTTVKGVRNFSGHAGFYQCFIQDFSKIARPMTHLIEKETPFVFSKECVDVFDTLKKKLTDASILVVPDWNLPFELMCDSSDFVIGAVLGQRKTKHFQPIHYASKTMTEAQIHYTTTEKEMLAVVYAFEKFWPYLVLSKSIVYTDHSALKYLLSKQDAKPRLENPHKDVLENEDINENFPLETLGSLSSGSTPWAIISDRGTHFCNDQFTRVMFKYGVTHHLATTYHPQTGGQVEVSNRGLKCILERMVGENYASWSDKLDDALWAFRTAFKTPIGGTPYKLLQLNELNEIRDQAYDNSLIYKERTKKLHHSKIKNLIFNVGDQVLLFNSRLKIFSGKIKTRWSGPFTITQVFPYGTIELSQPDGANFKYGVTHRFATTYHPQPSGQIEVSNRGLKRIIERTVGENRASWSEKLEDALWSFRTAYKTSIGCTPYKLVYEKSCHLPIELEHKTYWALKHVNFDLKTAGDHQKLQH